MGVVILDGARLAAERLPALRSRAAAVAARRGRPPGLLILAFADPRGVAPWLRGKKRAAAAAGIEVETLVVAAGTGTAAAEAAFREAAGRGADGVFVQFPYPAGVDGDALAAAIPPAADVDVMHPARVAEYLAGGGDRPPVTICAILLLLDGSGVAIAARRCAVVSRQPTDFERMLVEALTRRGAVARIERVDAPGLASRLRDTAIIITSVGTPGSVPGSALPEGAIVVDGGYFNPGARGDVAADAGVHHLGAFSPVPGGIGPLTVSALLEAVVARAESM